MCDLVTQVKSEGFLQKYVTCQAEDMKENDKEIQGIEQETMRMML